MPTSHVQKDLAPGLPRLFARSLGSGVFLHIPLYVQ